MDVSFDQPGSGEPPAGVIARASLPEPLTVEPWADRRDPAIGDADIDRSTIWPVGEPDIAYDQIHARNFHSGGGSWFSPLLFRLTGEGRCPRQPWVPTSVGMAIDRYRVFGVYDIAGS